MGGVGGHQVVKLYITLQLGPRTCNSKLCRRSKGCVSHPAIELVLRRHFRGSLSTSSHPYSCAKNDVYKTRRLSYLGWTWILYRQPRQLITRASDLLTFLLKGNGYQWI